MAQPACFQCHKEEAASYARTGMGQSVGTTLPGRAQFRHERFGTLFRVNGTAHEAERSGLKAKHLIAIRIGSGKVGSSFAVRIDGRLFQSPISWYAQDQQFRVSPGFEEERYPDFDRPIREECLTCHASVDGSDIRTIGCERCHSPGATHQRQPLKANIVNPARLTGSMAASVCEQCHLAGVARVLNPQRSFADFVPGKALENFWTVYVANTGFRVTSHVEQLAVSKCRRPTVDSLTCWSCHNPHITSRRPVRTFDSVCLDCHRPHEDGESNCAGCHMPKRSTTDVVHAAYTDHRIQSPNSPDRILDGTLRAWRPASPGLERRNRALALFLHGEKANNSAMLLEASALLDTLTTGGDAAVLTAMGSSLLRKQRFQEASDRLRQVTEIDPKDASAWFRLGLAEQSLGLSSASERYEKAMQLDPFFLEPYVALAQSQRASGDSSALQRYFDGISSSLRRASQCGRLLLRRGRGGRLKTFVAEVCLDRPHLATENRRVIFRYGAYSAASPPPEIRSLIAWNSS